MIRIGIIGSGFGQYGLLPAFNSIPGCRVVALCGKKRPQLVAYCQKIGFTNLYEDWQEMLEAETLDAVALAVTPEAQYEIATYAITQGLHIFAEKPLAPTFLKAKKLLERAKKKKIITAVDFMFPEIAAWQKVKQLLDKKTFGPLEHLSVNWDFLSYDIKHQVKTWKTSVPQGGGALSFFFSHGLYYLEHFAGKITRVKSLLSFAKESKNGAEAGANLLLTFRSGATGVARVYANSKGLARHELIFYCKKGVIVLENKKRVVDNFTISIYDEHGKQKLSLKRDTGRKGEDERVKIVRKLAKRFVKACQTKSPMRPSFTDGVRVQELIELIRATK